MKKLTILIAAGVGYVLGAKAGRTRYEQLRRGARRVADDPRVHEAAHKAQETVQHRAPAVKDTVSAVASKVRRGDETGGSSETGWPADPAATDSSGNGHPGTGGGV